MKIMFVDMDGTIADFYDINHKISISEFPDGFFINKKPLKCVIQVLQTVPPFKDCSPIILSLSPNEKTTLEKNEWLNKYYNVNVNMRVFLQFPNSDKAEYIYNFLKNNPSISPNDVYIIDDDHNTLRRCEKLGIHCIHPSHLVTLFEDTTIM